jgi:hypothetical protein
MAPFGKRLEIFRTFQGKVFRGSKLKKTGWDFSPPKNSLLVIN